MARILIVDDPGAAASMASLLGATGHTIRVAADSAEEMARALTPPPDLIIIEVMLPERDVYRLVRQVRSDPALARTRIMFSTATYLLNEARAIAAACSVAHVFARPAEPPTILAAVATALASTPPDAAPDAAPDGAYTRLLASEAHYRMLVENANDLIQRVTPDAHLVYVNQAWLRAMGYTADEIGRMRLWDIIAPEEHPTCQHIFARILAGEVLDAVQITFVRKDGRRIVLEGHITAQRVEGQIVATQASFRDITLRKQAEAQAAHALRESEAKFRLLSEQSLLGIAIIQSDRIKYANEAVAQINGYTVAEMVTWSQVDFARLIHPDDLAFASEQAAKKQRGDPTAVTQYAYRLRTKSGAIRWVEQFSKTILYEDQPADLVTLLDITARKEVETALRTANRALRMLSDCNQLLIRSTDEQALLTHICQVVVETGEYRLAWVGYAEHDTEQSVRAVAQFGFDDGYLDTVRISWADTERGRGPTGTSIRTGQCVIAHDISHDPLFAPWREQAHIRSFAASIGLPLIVDGVTIGSLGIYAAHPDAFDEAETALLVELTDDLSYGIATLRAREAHAQAEAALARSERRHAALIEHTWEAIVLLSADGRIRYASPTTTRILGYTPEEMTTFNAADIIHPDDVAALRERLQISLSHPSTLIPVAGRARHKNGEWRYLDGMFNNLLQDEAIGGILNNYRDMTEQRRLQEQFLQAQKMDVIGRLAGGVAHDFNNLLTAIQGLAELCLLDHTLGEQTRADLLEIGRASRRATTLTRQLLTFARQQPLELKVVDLNSLIVESGNLLRRLISADVELSVAPGANLHRTRVDPAQIEQVIINLVINARDAMPDGGRLTIETANVELNERYIQTHADIVPGSYVMLAVNDTGTGMPPAIVARAFEPFFTTKPQGKGTGLGLSTCYGIIRQHHGYVWIYSEVGRGTSVKCYLPALLDGAAKMPDVVEDEAVLRGTETILLVEDESQVRAFALRALTSLGYTVLEATNGEEALSLALRAGGRIDLLLTDLMMPLMSGAALVERYQAIWPDGKVLYISGYTGATIVQHGVPEPDQRFLQKPFTSAALARRVRQVLVNG